MGKLVAKIPNNDAERLQRILDDKQRTIGVDVEALNNQISEKKQTDIEQQTLENTYARNNELSSLRVRQLQLEAERQRHEINLDCAEYWTTQQGKNTTHEWDLNRKDALMISKPARLNDEDPRCGPSSFQKFDGEDLKAEDRKKAQQEENRTTWESQIQEHQKHKHNQALESAKDAQLLKQQTSLCNAVANKALRLRHESKQHVFKENMNLAEEKMEKEIQMKEANEEQNLQELNNMQESAFLNEAVSAEARRECWKGMKAAEIKQIYSQVEDQCTQKKEAKTNVQAEVDHNALHDYRIRQKAFSVAKEAELQKKQQSKQHAEMLKEQMKQKQKQDLKRNEIYTNHVTTAYFEQFQTSHR